MSEPEIATRAPESDAAEASSFPSDSQAQAGASMGEHCTTDRPNTGQRPTGEMTKFKDIDVYISKPADYPHSPSKLLLLLTGGTGVKSTNNQLQADMYASQGFVVVMPDQFSGDPASTTTTAIEENPSLIEQVKIKAVETVKSFMIDMWLARHTPEKVLPIIHTVLESAKDEYADAVANGGGIYAAGYCFGAKYVIMLAGEHPDSVLFGQQPRDEEAGMTSKGALIKAGAIAHATLVTREDLLALKAPVSMACVGKSGIGANGILANDLYRK
jgi:dienelactone hydrolase